MNLINPGVVAPLFVLPDPDMRKVALADLLGRGLWVVAYFYLRDQAAACTTQALEFSAQLADFEARGAMVLGVSRDTCVSHGAFRDEHGLGQLLLSDFEGEVSAAYGVLDPSVQAQDGRPKAIRSTFIIDPSGQVRHALYGVRPRGHAEAVLQLLQQSQAEPAPPPQPPAQPA